MKILIIGSGSIGKRHIRNVKKLLDAREDGSEVIAFDVSEEALIFVRKEYGVRTTTNLDQILKEADGVFICTPNNLHARLALQAVKNGCHVLVEKPLAHTMEHVDEILAVAKEKNLTLTVGYMMRFYEPLQKVKKLIMDRKLGKIYGAMVQFGYYLPDWRPNIDYRKNYGAIKEQGGGVILDCIHEINLIQWLFGDVESVYCLGGKPSNLEIDTEDYSSMSLRCQNGIIVNLHLDYLQRTYSRGIKVIAEKGTIIWNFSGHKLKIYNADTKKWSITSMENFDFNKTYLAEEKHFLACVDGTQLPEITGEEAKRDLRLALAAIQSLETGSPVRL